MWIDKYLSKKDIEEIEHAIETAENFTAGEIVPVIVRRSSRIRHVPVMVTMLLTLAVLILEIPFMEILWVKPWSYLWIVVILAIYLLSLLLSKIYWVQKLCVPDLDEEDAVQERAELEFYRNKVNRTSGSTGILIFLSVLEKRAVILADKGIAEKLPAEHWSEILQVLNAKLAKNQWGEGFKEAIRICGEDLKAHFPMDANIPNELKNHLIIK